MKFILILFLFSFTASVNAQNIFKETIFEILRSKKGDSVYNKWLNDYTWTTHTPEAGAEVLSCAIKKDKKAKFSLIVYLWKGQVQAVTIMNFEKKQTYGKYKGELPLQLKWGQDWIDIEKGGLTGTKFMYGVKGSVMGWNYLLGFEELDFSKSKYELTEELKYKVMVPKKLNRITFNAGFGPQYLIGIRN